MSCVLVATLFWPRESFAEEATPDSLANLPCQDLEVRFYLEIPRNVYDDLPDQVFEWVMRLDAECELGEPMGRTQILASIWDGNFQEIIYGYQVISWLADRYDPVKQPKPDSDRALFDTFTVDFASQMLPHTEAGTLERFFCLFYAGQKERAWALLQTDDLVDTWLRYYYDDEVHKLRRASEPFALGLHYGGWWPRGDIEFVGSKKLVGMSLLRNTQWGFWRFVVESRVGRSDEPYFVDEEGVTGRSNRWDAVLLAVEAGYKVWRSGPHQADVVAGLGLDNVKPFLDEEVAPTSFNLSLGVRYRLYLTEAKRVFLHADGRYEMIGDRNVDGDNLGGQAYSVRIGLGWMLGESPEPRLQALGQ